MMYPSDEYRGSNPTDFWRSRTHTAAKEHRCDDCGKSINRGERYLYTIIKHDGEFKTYHSHAKGGLCEEEVKDIRTHIEDYENE